MIVRLLALAAVAEHGTMKINSTTVIPTHTVSGFSAGADMAVDHFVAFSSKAKGLGVASGAPYGCVVLPNALTNCGSYTERVWDGAVKKFWAYTKAKEAAGDIDPVINMKGSPIYL
jgi:hypothetical protein